jgi:ABC-type dipeptide/oligopeptide/nickel transport system ATPase component
MNQHRALILTPHHKIMHILESIDVSAIIISHDMDFISHTTGVIYGMLDGRITKERGEFAHSHVLYPWSWRGAPYPL